MIRTLVVDDDLAAARLHARYLGEVPGFAVAGIARTGEETLRLLGEGADLVLLDMNLPDFSGVEVLHRMRTGIAPHVDVLVISSARDVTSVRQALSAQVFGYLVKPFTKDVFARRLCAYRDGRGEHPAEVGVPLGQGDIDAILSVPVGRTPAERPEGLPKGLSEATLALVLHALDPVTAATVREVATRSGASAPTVRRYLDHLARTGRVSVSHRFGGRGRPEVLYRLAL